MEEQNKEIPDSEADVDVDFEDDGFFEPTIEEAIMASGLHKQFVPD